MVSNLETVLERLNNEALKIRRNLWRAFYAAGSGHVGGSSSAADILAALYFHFLKVRPNEPDWPERDRFVLSKGHANGALAAVLAQAGFIPESYLDEFYGYQTLMGMHPDIKLAGVEMSTGGLGHGLSIGVGMALAARLKKSVSRTLVMIGDGELQEGSNWEAAMAASHLGLSSLTAILDYNKIQQSGHVHEVLGVEPVADKWCAFGWTVREIDGHNMAEIVAALEALPYANGAPSIVIAHTVKGKGVSFAEDTHLWHQNSIDYEVYQKALAELGEPA